MQNIDARRISPSFTLLQSHNLGRGHAWGKHPSHGEETSVLSAFKEGEYGFQGPQLCFNAAENSQFHWYDSRVVSFKPLIEGNRVMQLISVVDWDTTPPTIPAIITIDDSLFLQFNRKASFTNGLPQTFANQVMVTRTAQGYNERVASLKVGETISVDFLYEYATLSIKVNGFDPVSLIATISLEIIATPSSAPSESKIPSDSQRPSFSPAPSYVKKCNDTPFAGIHFISQSGSKVFSRCHEIPQNNWEDLACPQWNQRLLPPRERVYETCGNQCSTWSGCGLPPQT
jgi:hypothetical protein